MSDNATYRLQIRNVGSVHLGRSDPGARQQDHVYFRPTLEHCMEAKVHLHKGPSTLPFLLSGVEVHRVTTTVNGHACFCRSEDGGMRGEG